MGIYGEPRITRRKLNDYLGMTLNFRTPGELQVIIFNDLKWVLEDSSEVITWKIKSPTAVHLFQVRPEDERRLLDEERETAFHHTVVQFLFVTLRDRNYINMDVALICAQVRILYNDD